VSSSVSPTVKFLEEIGAGATPKVAAARLTNPSINSIAMTAVRSGYFRSEENWNGFISYPGRGQYNRKTSVIKPKMASKFRDNYRDARLPLFFTSYFTFLCGFPRKDFKQKKFCKSWRFSKLLTTIP